jgi:uncharacterized membrane-anchored protein
MSLSNKEKFLRDGYIIIDVLTQQEIDEYRQIMDAMISPEIQSKEAGKRSASFQHLGDEISDFGKEATPNSSYGLPQCSL